MKKLLFVIFVLLCTPSFAATYYIAASGSGTTCSIGSPCADSYVDTLMASLAPGDTVAFNKGDTFASSGHHVTSFGTVGNPITFTSYGTGAKPKFSKLNTFAPSWSLYSGAIYSATMDSGMTSLYSKRVNVFLQDGTRLNAVAWNTNIATTAAAMTAGTYTLDTTNNLIYVWCSDGASPAGKTMQYSPIMSYFYANTNDKINGVQQGAQYLVFDGLELNYANGKSIVCGDFSNACSAACSNITVQNCDFKYGGGTAVDISGNNLNINHNTAYDTSATFAWLGDGPVYVSQCGSGFNISDNTADITRRGTGIEINFGSTNGRVHHNTITRGYGSCFEFYSDASHSTTSNNTLDHNYCNQTNAPYAQSGGSGISVSQYSTNNTAYDNILISSTGFAARLKQASNNFLYNNTFVSPASGWPNCAVYSYTSSSTNTLKNNIFYSTKGSSQCFVKSDSADDVLDYNSYWETSGTFTGNWDSSTQASFALYKTASGQDAHSINVNPSLDASYKPQVSSPVVDVGLTIALVTDDYLGTPRPQGSAYDIGAYEYFSSSRTTINGVTLIGATVR